MTLDQNKSNLEPSHKTNMDTSKTHPPVIDHMLLEQPKKTNVALQKIKPSTENLNTTPDPHMSL